MGRTIEWWGIEYPIDWLVVEDVILTSLLYITLFFAFGLLVTSAATAVRKLIDLEYQKFAGLDGIRKIQSHINILTQINSFALGLMFIIITGLLLGDAPMWVRTWVNRFMFAVLMGSFFGSSIFYWRSEKKQLKLSMQEDAKQRVVDDEGMRQEGRDDK